jgi:nicotinamide-nucleotide amidase
MKAIILPIGDEILIGQVLDTNSHWLCGMLNLNGIQVLEIRAVPDVPEAILTAVETALAQADLVLTTGGLGPTKDDLTKKLLADYFGHELAFHQPTFDNLVRLFAGFNRPVTDAYKLQCHMPVGAEILSNPVGTAPGMWFQRDGKVLVSMPGVPFEMKLLTENEVLPRLRERFPASPIRHRTVLTVGVGETQLAEQLEAVENALPAHIKLAYLPYLGGVRLRLTARGDDAACLDRDLDTWKEKLLVPIRDWVFGFEEDTLEGVVGRLLLEKKLRMATAESCTGGSIAQRITSVPGASAYFLGSIVAYDNSVKEKLLGVSPQTLHSAGAVSEDTVREMVAGALKALSADVALAVSGIAGPSGGTPDKPVGTVCLAVGNAQHVRTKTVRFGRDREKNIQLATTTALNLIRKFLLDLA